MVVKLILFDSRLLDGPVHALNAAIRPMVVRLGQSVLDALGAAIHVQAMDPQAGRPAIPVLWMIGEMNGPRH